MLLQSLPHLGCVIAAQGLGENCVGFRAVRVWRRSEGRTDLQSCQVSDAPRPLDLAWEHAA